MENKELGNKRTMKFIGKDDWGRPVYKCVETGTLWKDIELGDSEFPQLCSCGNNFDGEPDCPISSDLQLVFVGNENEPTKEERFNYMMLSRLQADCEYFLGYGNRHTKHLYYQDEQKHIDEMKLLHNSFSEHKKPEWLTMVQIEKYEEHMVGKKGDEL